MNIKTYHFTGRTLTGGTVMALGQFDGVHLGHAAVIGTACEAAKQSGYAAGVWTFDSIPFGTSKELSGVCERMEQFRRLGADFAVVCDFDSVRTLSPEQFAKEILIRAFHVKRCVCGYDFRFGYRGEGTPELLERLIGAVRVPPLCCDGETISSTRIRRLISGGDMDSAVKLLGHGYTLCAEVIRGNRIGRTIGIPTINQPFPEKRLIPPYGVYASEVTLGARTYKAVSNIGVKPTVMGMGAQIESPLCETHIIGYDGDLYGQTVTVSIYKFLRPETKFSSVDELKAAIRRDIEKVRGDEGHRGCDGGKGCPMKQQSCFLPPAIQ